MNQFKNNKSIATILIAFLIVVIGIIAVAFGEAETSVMIFLIFVIAMIYHSLVSKISRSSEYSTILCDSRFYVFSTILMYSILPPIYCLLTLHQNGGARVRTAYNATIYTSEELFKTVVMSTLLFIGMLIGFSIREHKRETRPQDINSEQIEEYTNTKKFIGWLIVCVISTVLYYIPFLRGGFKIIQLGGTILDVDTTVSTGLLGNIQSIFFSTDIMSASTAAMLYYAYKMNISQRSRRLILIVTIALQVIGAFLTTRRARGLSIMLCAFVIYIYWYEKRKKKLPWTQILIVAAAFVFLYLLEIIMGQRQATGGIAGYIRLFDGIPAYDSLLRSTRESTSISMLSNIIYGIFRPIPVLGKYIVQFFGMPSDAAPLYHWMAERYTTYQIGGGLAYTPQLEAYLCLGYIGCFLFGIVYGYVFGKKRHGLINLFVIAMAFSIARGTLQIVLKLLWPFGIIGYFFYDQLLFTRITIGSKRRSNSSQVSLGQSNTRG